MEQTRIVHKMPPVAERFAPNRCEESAGFSSFVTFLSSIQIPRPMTDLPDTDYTQRFIFDDSDTRGELVALERSYAEVLAKAPVPGAGRAVAGAN